MYTEPVKLGRSIPKVLFYDNSSEFTSQAMALWAYLHRRRSTSLDQASRPIEPSWNRSTGRSVPNAWILTGSWI